MLPVLNFYYLKRWQLRSLRLSLKVGRPYFFRIDNAFNASSMDNFLMASATNLTFLGATLTDFDDAIISIFYVLLISLATTLP